MMTNDLSLNDRHVFISNLVIDSRQTNLRLVVDKLLTEYLVHQLLDLDDFVIVSWIIKTKKDRKEDLKVLSTHDQRSKLVTHIAFVIRIFENDDHEFQHHVSILEVIDIDITYWLYVIIDLINNSFNYRSDCEQVRVIMINVDRHFIMHFCLSNVSNRIHFIDENRRIWVCFESSLVLLEVSQVVLIVALFIIWVENAISSRDQQSVVILFEKIVIVLFDFELIARFFVIILQNIHFFTNLIEFDVRIDQLISIDVDDIVQVLILSQNV